MFASGIGTDLATDCSFFFIGSVQKLLADSGFHHFASLPRPSMAVSAAVKRPKQSTGSSTPE